MSVETTLSIDDVAALVDKSPDWVKRRAPRFEHLKVGRTLRFTADQAETFIRSFVVRPGDTNVPESKDPLRDQTDRSRNRK